MRLRTLGAVCATSAIAVPISAVVPFALAEDAPPAPPSAPAPGMTPLPEERAPLMARLSSRHLHYAHRYHRLQDKPFGARKRSRLRARVLAMTPSALRSETRELRHAIRRLRRHMARTLHRRAHRRVAIPPQLQAIAMCESHGNPRAVSAGGTYRGKYQFSYATWRSVGGSGDPARASEREQDRRAARLYRTGGPGHWPVCGR